MALETVPKDALFKERNGGTSVSIQSLPNEILSYVFLLHFLNNKNPGGASRTLQLVSKHWCNVACGIPELRGLICDMAPLEYNRQRILSFGSNEPLNIICFKWDTDFLDLVGRRVHQWRSFELRRMQPVDIWSRYPYIRAAPRLESFIVDVEGGGDGWHRHKMVDLFHGFAPRLRRLEIPSLSIPWSSSKMLSNLQVLRMSAWDGSRPLPVETMCQVLSTCSKLEELYLHGAFAPSQSQRRSEPIRTIPLPHLRVLDLYDVPLSWLSHLLQAIRAPSLFFFTCHTSVEASALIPVFKNLPKDGVLATISKRIEDIDVQACAGRSPGYEIKSMCNKETPAFVLRMSNEFCAVDPIHTISLISPSYPSLRTLRLPPSIDFSSWPKDCGPRTFLLQFPALERLIIQGDKTKHLTDDLLLAMSTPLVAFEESGAQSRWVCPGLRHLEITDSKFDIRNLIRFVESRYDSDDPREGISPTRLESLNLDQSEYGLEGAEMDDHSGLKGLLWQIGTIVGLEDLKINSRLDDVEVASDSVASEGSNTEGDLDRHS